MLIAQLANFYGPRSGGLRTALHQWGSEYRASGLDVALVVPGPRDEQELMENGVRRITLASLRLPGSGGYRLADPRRVADVLAGLGPGALEVSDRLPLRGFGRWAREHGIPSAVVSHERLDRLIGQVLPAAPAQRLADAANRAMARSFDTVVCTTAFAASEFDRIGARNVRRVPLGVDLERFHPRNHDPRLRARLAPGKEILLVHSGRLSVEKHAERSIEALRILRGAGVNARLIVAGDGPRRGALERRARGLPVEFLGFVSDPEQLSALLATADVAVAPGPHETFCLSALEALASGTPVVASESSALREILTGGSGMVAADEDAAFATALGALLARDAGARARARERAEAFTWSRSASAMLEALIPAPLGDMP
ncbi:glycosyltransferase [Hoyosella sp. G463]|uniref:Glycosyltransferase n=1 Tax=Lolliginicoccus lacisalsi TaxID=2742202 RepID=A0A927JEV8_9ACTN|nr:glycosyltransferase [Lolliginicoccus lacisalsi]